MHPNPFWLPVQGWGAFADAEHPLSWYKQWWFLSAAAQSSCVYKHRTHTSPLGISSLFVHRNNAHISLALSRTTKGTKCVSDYATDTESREAQHSQTVTNGNSERLPCPLQPQQVETSCVFCISLSCTIINLYMTPRGQVIMVYFQMTHEQVCRKRVWAAQKTGKWNI